MNRLLIIITVALLLIGVGCDKRRSNPLETLPQPPTQIADDSLSSSSKEIVPSAIVTQAKPHPKLRAKKSPVAISKLFHSGRTDSLCVAGATLYVPAGSLASARSLSITPLSTDELPPLPAGMVNVTAHSSGFRFLPHGNHFVNGMARVVIPFDSLAIPKGYTAKDIRTFYYDEVTSLWTVLPRDTIRLQEQLAIAYTSHFTDMLNGIIQVPETPETQTYTPTSISELKAADPTQGMTVIAPPTPNNSGAASLQYPIDLPAGRAGMQPLLSLTYNSEGGSGFVGYGWSLSLPSIDIDSRWGVPTFDPTHESENYQLLGESFSEQIHRTLPQPRTAEKQFFPRIEESFSVIIRHGDSPSNYTWEVSDKNGTIHYYGGNQASVDEECVIRNDAGAIIRWVLRESREVHGNFIRYYYRSIGKTLYPSHIVYTGFADQEGIHRVEFDYYPSGESPRKDRLTSARLGTLQSDAELLRSIRIATNGSSLRSYVLNYDSGAFEKTRLSGVTQCDAAHTPLYTHHFDYYNDIAEGLFGPAEEWSTEQPPLFGAGKLFATLKDGYDSSLSMLSSSASNGFAAGAGFAVGFGPLKGNVVYAGVSYQYGQQNSTGKITMIDLNGDGLPDKVYTQNNRIWFSPNISRQGGNSRFGTPKEVGGTLSEFSRTRSESHSAGADAGAQVAGASAGISYSHTWETSHTTIYIQDFNSDGLPDIAMNGTVFFNSLRDGVPYFDRSSLITPNPIAASDPSLIDGLFKPDYDEERRKLEEQFPLHDVVRLWRAPADGEVVIGGSIVKRTEANDGVNMSIQHEHTVLWSDAILATGERTPSLTRTVRAGDRIFFRLQSVYSGTGDEVEWNPTVDYTTSPWATELDENGLNLLHYDSKGDFLGCNVPDLYLVRPGNVTLTAPYSKGVLSDDVTLIVTSTHKTVTTEVKRITLPANEELSGDMTWNLAIQQGDTLTYSFHIESESPVNWNSLKWTPQAQYDLEPEVMKAAPILPQWNKVLTIAPSVRIESVEADSLYLPGYIVVPYLHATLQPSSFASVQTLRFALKETLSGSFFRKQYDFPTSEAALDSIRLDSLPQSRINASFYVDAEVNKCHQAGIRIYRDRVYKITVGETVIDSIARELQHTVPASLYSRFDNQDYGTLYRGWGQFAYNGNAPYQDAPIDTQVLFVDMQAYKDMGENPDPEVLESLSTPPNKARFYLLGYNPNKDAYIGMTDKAYWGASLQSSSRLGNPEIEVPVIDYPTDGESVFATNLFSRTESDGVSASAGYGAVGANANASTATSHTELSTMDINGDGYPDWIERKNNAMRIKYTGVDGKGGVSEHLFDLSLPVQKTNAIGAGISTGLSVPCVAPKRKESSTIAQNTNASQQGESASSAVSVSGNFSTNTSYSENEWGDINGDGLPDMIYLGGKARLNLGYGFSQPIDFGHAGVFRTKSQSFGAGLGFSYTVMGNNKKRSIGGGANATYSLSNNEFMLTDLNGDGLPDMLFQNGDTWSAAYNTGSGFEAGPFCNTKGLNESKSVSMAGYANVAFTVHIPVVSINLTPSINFSTSTSMSKAQSQLMDVDGDGYPDLVFSVSDDKMVVHRSRIGRTNLLRSVKLPYGGRMTVDYATEGNTYDMPQAKRVLSSLEIEGGMPENGATRQRSSFVYKGGVYDRRERLFFGFAEVESHHWNTADGELYRKEQLAFRNRSYHTRRLLERQTMLRADGSPIYQTDYLYQPIEVRPGTFFPALTEQTRQEFDPISGNNMRSSEHFRYDDWGNMVHYRSVAGDELEGTISYHTLARIKNAPASVEITASGSLLRKSSTEVNERGDVLRLVRHNGTTPSVYEMAYDSYGNITRMTRPENYKGERLSLAYSYDGLRHNLVTRVEDSYGYSSTTEYDPLWGLPTRTTDMNGQSMLYRYDAQGRIIRLTGPKEIAAGKPYTLEFEYHSEASTPYALTRHYAPEGDLLTYTFADALMRPVQIKKSGEVFDGDESREVMIVEPRQVVDAFGRVVRSHFPITENSSQGSVYNQTVDPNFILTDYDELNREVGRTLADGSRTTIAYALSNLDGESVWEQTVTDAEGNRTITYTDARGRTRKVVRPGAGEEVTVAYRLNALGEVLQTIHPNGRTTSYEYDALGRTLSVNHPDAGETRLSYDAAGNLLTRQTPNLRELASSGGVVRYHYEYERLVEKLYPKNLFNRVNYTYGKAGDAHNRAGRLVLVEDGSGAEEYRYGEMGEVTQTVKTILVSETDMRTYVFGAEYDSWNRVRALHYPDGERVVYGYNRAGQMTSLVGTKQGDSCHYVERMGYDRFGQLVYRRQGNGAVSRYAYDPLRQRLSEMQLTAGGRELTRNRYRYDRVDNILGIEGTDYQHSYSYDALDRLTGAQGVCREASYSLQMRYDVMSNPLSKQQTVQGSKVAQNQDFSYLYEAKQPNAVSSIGSSRYHYDANGNPTAVENDTTSRRLLWDEENRLMMLSDDGYTSRYTYNHSGERVIKSHGATEGVYINGAPQGVIHHDAENYTLYVSPYFVAGKDRFTKHYYSGMQRLASKIGTGGFSNVYGYRGSTLTAGGKNYIQRMKEIERGRTEYYQSLGTPPGLPTMKGHYSEPEETNRPLPNIVLGNYDVPKSWPTPPKFSEPGAPPGPPIQWQPNTPQTAASGYGYVPAAEPEREVFFYHSDHLGSTAYITDRNGAVSQFICYMPYGEALVDEHSSSTEEQPYKFNGKEMDRETGLYYYGARYYDPSKSGVWYGIDPLTEKYPALSPYSYCAGNPVRYVDPDGRDWYQNDSGETFWKRGSDAIDGFKNIGATYLQNAGNGISINYTQNQAISITEHVLDKKDFSSQMTKNQEGRIVKKAGEEGNCFVQAGKMVAKTGAQSLGGDANGIKEANSGVDYLNSQINQGKSARVQVDRNGDNQGDHWVAISSRTTDVPTQKATSYGFYDPATTRPDAGTSNYFNVGSDYLLKGKANYTKNTEYRVVQVRKNTK